MTLTDSNSISINYQKYYVIKVTKDDLGIMLVLFSAYNSHGIQSRLGSPERNERQVNNRQ